MRKLTAAAAALVLALPGLAAADTWNIDSAHTQTGFSVKHLVISTVKGEFGKTSGAVTYDEKDPSKSSVEATIDVTSINTRIPDRDNHLKSPDFFDAAKFPKITFKSTKVEKGAKANQLKVTGDLTIRDITKPVTLDVELSDEWQDPKEWGGNTHKGVKAVAKINRQDFKVTWQQKLDKGGVVAGDEVAIVINAELIKKAPAPAPAK